MTLGGALLLRQHFGSIRRLTACGTYGGYSGGSSLRSVCSFTRLGSSLAVLVCLHLGQQSVSSEHHSLRLVSGSIGLRALGQQSVSPQLHSLRRVTSSIGLLALGQQSVSSQLHSPWLVSSKYWFCLHWGSNLSVRSFTRLGSSLAVLVCLHLGSSLSVRSVTHFGSSVAVLLACAWAAVGQSAASFASARH